MRLHAFDDVAERSVVPAVRGSCGLRSVIVVERGVRGGAMRFGMRVAVPRGEDKRSSASKRGGYSSSNSKFVHRRSFHSG